MNKNAKKREKASYNKFEKIKNESIKEYKVKNNEELLEFLLNNVKSLSRNNIKNILKRKCIGVNGACVTQFNYQLIPGDVVLLSKFPLTSFKDKNNNKLEIIYEDEDFLAINKPAGLLSISSDKEKVKTAYKYALEYVREKNKFARIYVVHRIDKETSGVLIFAKNENLKNQLQENWNDLVSKRGYYAIVDGVLDKKEDTLKNYLKMNKENLMYVTKDKKDSQFCITHYKVIKENDKYSLLDINIDSGRKNQIRVQLGNIGHFVCGDDKYGDPSDPINRLALHSYELDLINPINKKEYKFKAPMPKIFNSVFK